MILMSGSMKGNGSMRLRTESYTGSLPTGTIRGAASFCLNWAFNKCGNLKIDTHRDNIVMQHLLDKNGFKYCGVVYLENGSERIAYQKV